jgi:hypothetical protein
LAVRVARLITSVLAAELRSRLERQLGLSGRVLVLEPGTELTVVTAADPATKAAVQPDPKHDAGAAGAAASDPDDPVHLVAIASRFSR